MHCSQLITEKYTLAKALLKALVDVSAVVFHVAKSLLRMCGGYCKVVQLACPPPPPATVRSFDDEVRLCFSAAPIGNKHSSVKDLVGFVPYPSTLVLLLSPPFLLQVKGVMQASICSRQFLTLINAQVSPHDSIQVLLPESFVQG